MPIFSEKKKLFCLKPEFQGNFHDERLGSADQECCKPPISHQTDQSLKAIYFMTKSELLFIILNNVSEVRRKEFFFEELRMFLL